MDEPDASGEESYREVCWRCRRPKALCLCPELPPMETATRIVLLMHPMEWKRQKCGTGRLTCLNLANSEIIPGLAFDSNRRFRELADDPDNYPVLVYPGDEAYDLSSGGMPEGMPGKRRLVAFLIDSTWACSKAVIRASPGLLALPRVKFTPAEPSRFVIKRQPRPECLSTVETVHQLLLALEKAGLDRYPDKTRLLTAFYAMRDYQIERAAEDPRPRFLGVGQAARLRPEA